MAKKKLNGSDQHCIACTEVMRGIKSPELRDVCYECTKLMELMGDGKKNA